MEFGMIGAGKLSRTVAGKRVAALSYYQTRHRDAPRSLDNDGSLA
jgi:hypothetical protein